MALEFRDLVTAANVLIREAIQSQNYAAGSAGWTINQDGSAEFNNLTIRGTFFGTNFIINSAGAFFYSAAPALGNLVVSVANAAGIDAYGNAYTSGVTVYSQTLLQFARMSGGNVAVGALTGAAGSAPDTANAGVLHGDASGTTQLAGQLVAGTNQQAFMQMVPGTAGASPIDTTRPRVDWVATSGSTSLLHRIRGAITGGNGTVGFATWQAPTFNTNWVSSTTFGGDTGMQPLQYRIDNQDNLVIEGCFASGAVAPTNTNVFDLPAGYVPAQNHPIPVQQRTSGGTLTSGFFFVTAVGSGTPGFRLRASTGFALAASSQYLVNGSIPLGNIA